MSCRDLVEETVQTHGAVPLLAAHHVGLHIHHAGAAGLHGDHVEAFTSQVVTRHKLGLLALGEGRDVASPGWWEEQEEEQEARPERGGGAEGAGRVGEHRRTDGGEEKLSDNRLQTAAGCRFKVWVSLLVHRLSSISSTSSQPSPTRHRTSIQVLA